MSQIIDLPLVKRLQRPSHSDKDGRGRVLVIGEGLDAAGALLLSGTAALRTGARELQIAAPPELAASLGVAVPEARIIPLDEALAGAAAQSDAVVVGASSTAEDGRPTRQFALAPGGAAYLLMAPAMTGLKPAEAQAFGGRLVLLAGLAEMAALRGRGQDEVLSEPLEIAREVAAAYQAVVIMNDRDSQIVGADGRAWQTAGNVAALATGGSGDVLAGIIAGLMARGFAPVDAAVIGAYLHGRAGWRLSHDVGSVGFLARELLEEIPLVMTDLSTAQTLPGSL
ncbi:MAG TPA: NAD(P)H-hydrate dehydratase [Phenylobacterium sp.]|uniref:ADP-dependent NAD(P)H-hydrate dehydratase n=1 Tax=Phenylobacterium sp. TaxID=1871053 RepID=UPI002F94FB8E